jgi:hypothetical protein
MKPHTIDASVVWLDMYTLDLAILGNDSVALATIIAEQGGTVKLDVPRASEVAGRVAKEADATGLILVERLGPCFHAVGFLSVSAILTWLVERDFAEWCHLHKCIVDRYNEHLACARQVRARNVAGDVGVGAGRGEGSWDADDKAFAGGEFAREVDIVAGRALDEGSGGDGVTDFDLFHLCQSPGWVE